jgi:hypothetical protein
MSRSESEHNKREKRIEELKWFRKQQTKKEKKIRDNNNKKKENQVKTLKQNVTYTLHYIRHAT